MMSIALRIEQLRTGPQACWAPPVLAIAIALAEAPGVLFIGKAMPWSLETALVGYGHLVEHAPTLSAGKAMLCAEHYKVVIAEHALPDADMVLFVAALKAGHALASGVPLAVKALPFVLLDGDDAVCLLEDGLPADVGGDGLPGFVLGLLDA